jgi:putative transcriptional regulator
MGRDKLRIAEVSRRTGLNRSTITALYRETATRVDLPAIEQLCRLFNCQVGDLFEFVDDDREAGSLSDLSDRSERVGEREQIDPTLRRIVVAIQRNGGAIWAALPPAQ